MSETQQNNEWETLKADEDYEINIIYPYQIRNKSNKRIIKESHKPNGYLRCKLNQKDYLKHRLIALQWILNPDNLPQIDHIDRNRTNNHIDNLRWTSNSENNKNKTTNHNIKYEYFDKIDDDAIAIIRYGKYRFKNYYYVSKEDNFYFYNNYQYRKLYKIIDKRDKIEYINLFDLNNKSRSIFINKFKKLNSIS